MMPPNLTSPQNRPVRRVNLLDAFDNYLNWIVCWVFLSAINLAMEAATFLVDNDLGQKLQGWAKFPTRLGGLAILGAVILFLWRRRQAGWKRVDRNSFFDGSTMENLKRAGFAAFLVAMPTVVVLDIVTNRTSLPADFFIKLPGVALTATFSLTFFFLNRAARGPDDDAEVLP